MSSRAALPFICAALIACSAAGGDADPRKPHTAAPDATAGEPTPPPASDAGSIYVPIEPDAGPADATRRADCGQILAIVRDFSSSHPDFEMAVGFDWTNPASWLNTTGLNGLVKPSLENGFPAYAHPGATTQTTGPLEFYQWYVDTPGVNVAIRVPMPLTEMSPGEFVYDNAAFFPIDSQGFGNENNLHNYHFTTEVRTEFTYLGGEVFTFRGDDDLWMFVNRELVIDLGGLHGPLEATVQMDQVAGQIGLVVGQTYSMDIFHAERHTFESNFRIQTNIQCFVPVEPPPPPPPPR